MGDPAETFESVVDWLQANYASYRFFVERDLVWTVQLRLIDLIAKSHPSHRVYNDYPILPGRRRSLSADIAVGGSILLRLGMVISVYVVLGGSALAIAGMRK